MSILEKGRSWKRAMVFTRLPGKGAVNTEPPGNRFFHAVDIDHSACEAGGTRSFLERMFGGALQPLVAHMAEHHALAKRDIAELKAWLEKIQPTC